jgi:DNA-directed RNA polymerase specialized sigma24 family protein
MVTSWEEGEGNSDELPSSKCRLSFGVRRQSVAAALWFSCSPGKWESGVALRLPPHSEDMSPAKKLHVLEQEEFDQLLSWLDPDPQRAGLTYEKIRWRIVAILASRGCACAEELADETIDRVARRVVDIQDSYVGDKAIYFLGVMNNVHHEYLKRPVMPRLPKRDDDAEAKEKTHQCLERCLDKLTTNSRQMIERYYAEDKQAKIDLRKRIAAEFGISPNTLRLRALRIREKLQTCIEQCLQTEMAQ